MIEMTKAPMIAALNELTVKPWMICPTNQKNAPLITRENSPRVKILSGSVRIVMTGFTTMFRKTKQAATITAVKILATEIPSTKYGRANIARTVINHRSKIILLLYYANNPSTIFLTIAPSACPPTSFITAPTNIPDFDLSAIPSSVCLATAIALIFSSDICSGINCSST